MQGAPVWNHRAVEDAVGEYSIELQSKMSISNKRPFTKDLSGYLHSFSILTFSHTHTHTQCAENL